jgi:hypothetical protein
VSPRPTIRAWGGVFLLKLLELAVVLVRPALPGGRSRRCQSWKHHTNWKQFRRKSRPKRSQRASVSATQCARKAPRHRSLRVEPTGHSLADTAAKQARRLFSRRHSSAASSSKATTSVLLRRIGSAFAAPGGGASSLAGAPTDRLPPSARRRRGPRPRSPPRRARPDPSAGRYRVGTREAFGPVARELPQRNHASRRLIGPSHHRCADAVSGITVVLDEDDLLAAQPELLASAESLWGKEIRFRVAAVLVIGSDCPSCWCVCCIASCAASFACSRAAAASGSSKSWSCATSWRSSGEEGSGRATRPSTERCSLRVGFVNSIPPQNQGIEEARQSL